MTNEEFQTLVLEKLTKFDEKFSLIDEKVSQIDAISEKVSQIDAISEKVSQISSISEKVSQIDEISKKLNRIELEVKKIANIETDIIEIKSKLNAVYNQTANLTEFRTEANMKLDSILDDNKSIHEIVGEHEISIRTLRRRVV